MACMVITYSKSKDQPGLVANPTRGQLNKENECFPCPRSCLRIWSRETGSAVSSRVSLLISIPRLNLVLTGFVPISAAASIYLLIPPYVIGSVPSLSDHTYAYRWRLLPRVRRHRAKRSQESSSNGCCPCRLPWTNSCVPLFPRPLLV